MNSANQIKQSSNGGILFNSISFIQFIFYLFFIFLFFSNFFPIHWLFQVDAAAVVTGAVTVLFALPAVRNTMPGAPPLGAVMDFAVYFWCIIISIMHILYIAGKYFCVCISVRTCKCGSTSTSVSTYIFLGII